MKKILLTFIIGILLIGIISAIFPCRENSPPASLPNGQRCTDHNLCTAQCRLACPDYFSVQGWCADPGMSSDCFCSCSDLAGCGICGTNEVTIETLLAITNDTQCQNSYISEGGFVPGLAYIGGRNFNCRNFYNLCGNCNPSDKICFSYQENYNLFPPIYLKKDVRCCQEQTVCLPEFMFYNQNQNPCATSCQNDSDCEYLCSGGICIPWIEGTTNQTQNKRGQEGTPATSQIISTESNFNPAIDNFYTNSSSNPITINLKKGESIQVNFWVNSTGMSNLEHPFYRYEFFAYINQTSGAKINKVSEKFFVDVYN